jgi:hypothetical protein
MGGDTDEFPGTSGRDTLAELRCTAAAVLSPRPPEPGERAAGHGVSGAVVAVSKHQPLAADTVWRVTLGGERFGRLVGRARDGAWRLLQLDDLTEAQLDVLGAAAADVPCQERLPASVI